MLAQDAVGAILRAADEAEVGQRVRRANYFGVYMRQRRARSSRHMQKLDLQSVMWSIPRDRIKREIPTVTLTLCRWRRASFKDQGTASHGWRQSGLLL